MTTFTPNVLLSNQSVTVDLELLERQVTNMSLHAHKEVPLLEFLNGKDVGDYIEYIESVLLDLESKKFRSLSPRDMQANVLLLLTLWAETKEDRYLGLLLKALTYAIDHLNGLLSPQIIDSINHSDADISHACRGRIQEFIDGCEVQTTQPWQDVKKLLVRIAINKTTTIDILPLLAQSLCYWEKQAVPDSTRMASRITNFADLACTWNPIYGQPQLVRCDLIKFFVPKINDGMYMMQVLFEACSHKYGKPVPFELQTPDWFDRLVSCEQNVFIDIVKSPRFSKDLIQQYLLHFISQKAPQGSLLRAAELTPVLSDSRLCGLLRVLENRSVQDPQLPTLGPVLEMLKSHGLSAATRDKLITYLAESCPHIIRKLEDVARICPQSPVVSIFIDTVNCPQFSQKTRTKFFQYYLGPKAPPHCLQFAFHFALSLTPEQREQVFSRMYEQICSNLSHLALQSSVSFQVKDAFFDYLLRKNTPASLWVALHFTHKLHFSRLWQLHKAVETLLTANRDTEVDDIIRTLEKCRIQVLELIHDRISNRHESFSTRRLIDIRRVHRAARKRREAESKAPPAPALPAPAAPAEVILPADALQPPASPTQTDEN